MYATFICSVIVCGLAASAVPATAQSMDHSAHSASMPQTHANHAAHEPSDTRSMAAVDDDVAGAKAVLAAYRSALVARDADAMSALFADESFMFENGKSEGSFADYLAHHLGPELGAIASFTFERPTVAVTRAGHLAYGRETYGYRIELTDGRVIARDGVATSILTHDASGWKIVQYHSSSRAPRSE